MTNIKYNLNFISKIDYIFLIFLCKAILLFRAIEMVGERINAMLYGVICIKNVS